MIRSDVDGQALEEGVRSRASFQSRGQTWCVQQALPCSRRDQKQSHYCARFLCLRSTLNSACPLPFLLSWFCEDASRLVLTVSRVKVSNRGCFPLTTTWEGCLW